MFFSYYRSKELRPEAKNFKIFFVHTVSIPFSYPYSKTCNCHPNINLSPRVNYAVSIEFDTVPVCTNIFKWIALDVNLSSSICLVIITVINVLVDELVFEATPMVWEIF